MLTDASIIGKIELALMELEKWDSLRKRPMQEDVYG